MVLRGAHQDLTVQGKNLAGVCFDMHLLAGDTGLGGVCSKGTRRCKEEGEGGQGRNQEMNGLPGKWRVNESRAYPVSRGENGFGLVTCKGLDPSQLPFFSQSFLKLFRRGIY